MLLWTFGFYTVASYGEKLLFEPDIAHAYINTKIEMIKIITVVVLFHSYSRWYV